MDGFINPDFMKVGMTGQVGARWSSRTLAVLHDRTNSDPPEFQPNNTIHPLIHLVCHVSISIQMTHSPAGTAQPAVHPSSSLIRTQSMTGDPVSPGFSPKPTG